MNLEDQTIEIKQEVEKPDKIDGIVNTAHIKLEKANPNYGVQCDSIKVEQVKLDKHDESNLDTPKHEYIWMETHEEVCEAENKKMKYENAIDMDPVQLAGESDSKIESITPTGATYDAVLERIKAEQIEENWDEASLSTDAIDQIKMEDQPAVKVKCEKPEEEPYMDITKLENIQTSELNEELDIKPESDPDPLSHSTSTRAVRRGKGLQIDPTEAERELYFCYNCDYTACSKVRLIRHISIGKCNIKANSDKSQLTRPMNVYVCTQCNKVFKKKSTLDGHVSKKHAESVGLVSSKMHNCTHCNYRSANKKNVIKHMWIHHNAVYESSICKHCNMSFRSLQALDNHIVQKHPNFIASVKRKTHECPHCTYKTIYKYHFNEHLLSHSSTECEHCNATFKSKRLLDDHIITEHPDAAPCYNLITCKHCHTTYKNKKLLDNHIIKKHPDFMESFTGKIYACLYCKYKTTIIHYYNRHMITHSSVRNVSTCEHCGAQFKLKRSLKDHIVKEHPDLSASVPSNIHECPNCGYITAQKIDLERHLLKHPEAADHNLISCKHCNTSCKSQQTLRNHIMKKHPELMASVTGKIHECSYCTYKTSMRHMFHEHILKKHPNFVDSVSCNIYECPNCDYKTTKKDNLDKHLLKHIAGSQNLISCEYCNATYKSKQSLDYHILKKHPDFIGSVIREIYKCSICPYKNTIKNRLEKHMLRHLKSS